MSQVFYRWGAGRDESRVKFDGTHISVFDFKRQVMLDNNLGNGKDFDLVVVENGEEMKDDNHQIARSSSLVVRRRPAVMKGRGTAQNYIIGTDSASALTGDHRIEAHAREAMKEKMFGRGARGATGGAFGSMTKRFDGKEDKAPQVKVTTGDADEDAKIAAMLQMQSETWEDMALDMSTQARFNTRAGDRRPFKPPGAGGPGGGGKFDFSVAPDKEPPVGYICYRCGQKGHWIQNCPKNEDPAAQDMKRFVRVTGIPRSFLQTVETPLSGEGSSGGAMLTADGGFVRAVPDQRQWQKQAAVKTRNEGSGDDDALIEKDLTCGLCKKLVRDAVRTQCCDHAYCEECIESYLLEHDFECPNCESKIPSLAKLVPATDLRERAAAFLEEKKKKGGEAEAEEESASASAGDVKTEGTTPAPDAATAAAAAAAAAAGGLGDVSGKNPYNGLMPDMSTLHDYQQAMMQTLRNPLVPPNIKQEIRAHVKITTTNLLQMQMLAAQGLIFGAQMGNAMMASQQMGMMGMGMGGMGGNMGMPGMNGMNMGNMGGMGGMGMPGMGNMNPMANMNPMGNMGNMNMNVNMNMNQNHNPVHAPRGRGGFRGGFRGRGFNRGGGQGRVVSGVKRGAEDMGGGVDKSQRVA